MKNAILISFFALCSCSVLSSDSSDIGISITDQTGLVMSEWGHKTEKTSHDGFTLEYPYPNPTLGYITFSFSFNSWRDNPLESSINISTLSGKAIHNEVIHVGGEDIYEYTFDMSGLSPGIYKVRMYTVTHYIALYTNEMRRDESKSLHQKLDHLKSISD